jgi:hypothetical protein
MLGLSAVTWAASAAVVLTGPDFEEVADFAAGLFVQPACRSMPRRSKDASHR